MSAPATAPAPARVTRRVRDAGPWALAMPWLMGAVLVLAAYLAWFTVDLLQNRLHESSIKFDATVHRFERFWTLHDAAKEAVLAVKWDLAASESRSAADSLQADALRFAQTSNALQAEIGQPGPLMLSQGPAWTQAVATLSDDLQPAHVAYERAHAPAHAQAVLDALARIGREARQRQSMSAVFLDEVEDVRHQVLIAISVIVAMLVLVVALAAQWVLVARRERASRGRAEHLAEVAEAERARAETADREKGRFLGMLSHELLTPLQSIWSTIDVIESRGRVEATEPSFRRLKEATRSLRGRISDLLDFAKMSSGRLETRIRGFQLDKLIDTALRDVEEVLADRNLDVHWEAGPELSQRLYSDPARLRQVIDNLLTNAIKYTERGGISISARLLAQEGVMRIEIADTGVGIDPAAMARLYEPFYRSPLTAGMAEGSGLGLAVVRSLVDLMGGTIRFDSQVGQGTVVTLEVPITEGTDGLVVDAPARVDARRPVLVVDDSRDARRAIADVIRSLGIEVVEAADGTSGLAAAAAGDFQAIFLDLQMPDLTGLQVAQRLRQAGDRHQNTFLALVSAYNDLDDATLDRLFDARIDKPAGRKELMAALGLAAQARASP
ncbi:hybrid sensor histidine kinase/response regulator [Scleromatobacter humisilvae]|uniref:histidine kinase n=1 Tax=Scleromatobacter humisilvae TaxID=2897159 RepID=A0A9X2BXA1_9BURK|nr:ATP-binding protein [Scleromatobacter humisilvae]MCK9684363.1 response regulator [Scleromatobacter humisilvae]